MAIAQITKRITSAITIHLIMYFHISFTPFLKGMRLTAPHLTVLYGQSILFLSSCQVLQIYIFPMGIILLSLLNNKASAVTSGLYNGITICVIWTRRLTAARKVLSLMLLGSPPDMVQKALPHRTNALISRHRTAVKMQANGIAAFIIKQKRSDFGNRWSYYTTLFKICK